MKLRQAKKIMSAMMWRAVLRPSARQAKARRIMARRYPLWMLRPVEGGELDTSQGRAWLRRVSRSPEMRAAARESAKSMTNLVLYGTASPSSEFLAMYAHPIKA